MPYLDRHYLEDLKVLQKIAGAFLAKNKVAFEIGIGDLRLTKLLIKKDFSKIIGCDIDLSKNILCENFQKENKNFTYINENGLNIIKNIEFDILFSNVPYSITHNLFKKILQKKTKEFCLLIGKKFYTNTIEVEDNFFNLLLQNLYDIEVLEEVSGSSFTPKTKVKSIVLKFTKKEKYNKFFELLIEKSNRNLKNCIIFSLVDFFNVSKKEANNIFEKMNIESSFFNKNIFDIKNKNLISYLNKKIKEM